MSRTLTVLLLAAWTVSFAAFLAKDQVVDYGNSAEHLLNALLMHDRLAGQRPLVPPGVWVYEPDDYYPPVPQVAGAAGVALGGRQRPAAIVATQVLWVLVLAGSAWTLARRLEAPPWAAGAATATAVLAPGVAMYARWYYPDLALAAVVALTWAVALQTAAMERFRDVLALALVTALGMLTKWTFPVYVAPLLAWTAWRTLRAGRALRLLTAVALACALTLPFYTRGSKVPLWQHLFGQLQIMHQSHERNPIGEEVPLPQIWHLRDFGLVLLWFPVTVLAAAGAGTAWRRSPDGRALVLNGAVALALASSISVQQNRYTLPLVGLAATLAALWATAGRPWRRWALAAAVAPTLGTMFAWLLPVQAWPRWVLPCSHPHSRDPGALAVLVPRAERTRVRELASEIAWQRQALGRDARPVGVAPSAHAPPARVLLVCDSAWTWSLRYWLAVERVPWGLVEIGSPQDLSTPTGAWQPGFRLTEPLPQPPTFDLVVADGRVPCRPEEGRLGDMRLADRLTDLGSFGVPSGPLRLLATRHPSPDGGLRDVPPGAFFSPLRPADWDANRDGPPRLDRLFDPYTLADRDEWQQPGRIWDAMGLRPGMAVADVGAGFGYFTFHLADRVGTEGLVYAVDLAPLALTFVRERSIREGAPQVIPLLRGPRDAGLPQHRLDAVFLGNTLQTAMFVPQGHMPWKSRTRAPEWYFETNGVGDLLASLHQALKPGGVLGVVDEVEPHLTPERTAQFFEAAGFRLESRHDFIRGNYLMVFRRLP